MKSTESNVQEAIELMGVMGTVDEIRAFIEGDTRKGVLTAAEERINELSGGGHRGKSVHFVPREVVLVDDMTVDGMVVRKIERTIVRKLVKDDKNGESLVETIESEKYVHGLYTVNCPRDSDPKGLKRVPISIDGTHPDGTSFQYVASIQRGINVPNVPYCALAVLANAIETRYWTEEKADRSGHEMKKESGPSYPFSIIEGPYWTRKPEK